MTSLIGKLEGYESRAGQIRVTALRQGGEDLVDRVDGAMGPALRHVARVRDGLALSDGVEREIEESFQRAEALL